MTVTIQPTQWGMLKDIHEVEPFTEKDAECFSEIKSVLDKYGLREKFGLALLHKHFELNDGEVVMEHTQREDRLQTLSPMKIKEIPHDTVPTIWKFSEEGAVMNVCRCYGRPHGNC